jgi:hypothetical protein
MDFFNFRNFFGVAGEKRVAAEAASGPAIALYHDFSSTTVNYDTSSSVTCDDITTMGFPAVSGGIGNLFGSTDGSELGQRKSITYAGSMILMDNGLNPNTSFTIRFKFKLINDTNNYNNVGGGNATGLFSLLPSSASDPMAVGLDAVMATLYGGSLALEGYDGVGTPFYIDLGNILPFVEGTWYTLEISFHAGTGQAYAFKDGVLIGSGVSDIGPVQTGEPLTRLVLGQTQWADITAPPASVNAPHFDDLAIFGGVVHTASHAGELPYDYSAYA